MLKLFSIAQFIKLSLLIFFASFWYYFFASFFGCPLYCYCSSNYPDCDSEKSNNYTGSKQYRKDVMNQFIHYKKRSKDIKSNKFSDKSDNYIGSKREKKI